MTSLSNVAAALLVVATLTQLCHVSSFMVIPSLRTFGARKMAPEESEAEPFFEMHQIPTATTSARLDHYIECAETDGACEVHEMMQMIDGKYGRRVERAETS